MALKEKLEPKRSKNAYQAGGRRQPVNIQALEMARSETPAYKVCSGKINGCLEK